MALLRRDRSRSGQGADPCWGALERVVRAGTRRCPTSADECSLSEGQKLEHAVHKVTGAGGPAVQLLADRIP